MHDGTNFWRFKLKPAITVNLNKPFSLRSYVCNLKRSFHPNWARMANLDGYKEYIKVSIMKEVYCSFLVYFGEEKSR